MCQRYPAFQEQNVEVLAIINEDQARCAKLKAEFGAPFPFLADVDRQSIREYGVFHRTDPDGRPIPVPGAFIVDAVGIIRYRFVGEIPVDRPETEAILLAISDLAAKPQF
ncbi:MAG: redoxin domain-containing protein [Chloroflexia bacterium]|nr:redoxin domain-containing protein [Chloroflexia bacterium]